MQQVHASPADQGRHVLICRFQIVITSPMHPREWSPRQCEETDCIDIICYAYNYHAKHPIKLGFAFDPSYIKDDGCNTCHLAWHQITMASSPGYPRSFLSDSADYHIQKSMVHPSKHACMCPITAKCLQMLYQQCRSPPFLFINLLPPSNHLSDWPGSLSWKLKLAHVARHCISTIPLCPWQRHVRPFFWEQQDACNLGASKTTSDVVWWANNSAVEIVCTACMQE